MPIRRASVGCLALAAVLLAAAPSHAQGVAWDTVRIPYEQIAGSQFLKMRDLRSGSLPVAQDLKGNREYLQRYARFLIYPVTEKQDSVPASADVRVRPNNENFDLVISALNSQLLIPTPAEGLAGMQLVQANFVIEFGAALDEAIGQVLRKPGVPPVVRTNAARLLAVAAKSGAPAIGRSIQKLLDHTYFGDAGKPADTPPEVLAHALVAAGNLLAAYDINVQNSPAGARHSLPEDELMKFIATLQRYVVEGPIKPLKVYIQLPDGSGQSIELNEKVAPPAAAPGQAPAAATLNAEQIAVARYFRRAAVRALAHCRFAIIGGRGGAADVRPALTLARVAVDDKSLSLPVTPPEALEAVIGLAGMEPSESLDLTSYAAALALGVRKVAGPKAASPDDTTLPARVAGARLTGAFKALATRAGTNARLKTSQKLFTDLTDIVVADVASRLAGEATAGAAPDFNRLDTFLTNLPPATNGRALFSDAPTSVLMPRPAR